MGAVEPPQLASRLPTRGCSMASSLDHAHIGHFPRAAAKETPSFLAHQETSSKTARGSPGWRLARDGRKAGAGARQAGKAVSFQLHSPQVRRTLVPWTERQTDRQTPCPF